MALTVVFMLVCVDATGRSLCWCLRQRLDWSCVILQDNLYWLGLLTHLQRDEVPGKTVDILRDLVNMYEAATVDDIYEALQHST